MRRYLADEVSVPLRGLDIRKRRIVVENFRYFSVSVPLRGLDIRKHYLIIILRLSKFVSVPLRGLDIRKHSHQIIGFCVLYRFSPLAGIRYSETQGLN